MDFQDHFYTTHNRRYTIHDIDFIAYRASHSCCFKFKIKTTCKVQENFAAIPKSNTTIINGWQTYKSVDQESTNAR